MTAAARVGIVIVSYNASAAIRTTLASVRQAKNAVPCEVVLVDNASAPGEREAIVRAFRHHQSQAGGGWKLIQQESNLGFAGGNNAAIRELVEREDISHVCLLNGDVIVTDHWVDWLVDKNVGIVSAVTNKADADQCVPVFYDLSLDQCLDGEREEVRPECLRRVREFAEFRRRTWDGQLVETDVTFFCVMLSVATVRRIGLLDERFFPGGYEDNDYCIRARAAGIPVHLARDVFVHHWGSASFGQLPSADFAGHASRNIAYLEAKHGVKVLRHPENPLVSYAADMLPILRSERDGTGLLAYHRCFRRSIDPLVQAFVADFKRVSGSGIAASRDLPEGLAERVRSAGTPGKLRERWYTIATRMEAMLSTDRRSPQGIVELSGELGSLIEAVRDLASCSLALREFQDSKGNSGSRQDTAFGGKAPTSGFRRLARNVVHGLRLLLKLRGVVFFGGYPYPERLGDGYFQRIRMVDSLFTDRWRVYVESTELAGRPHWFDRPEDKVIVLRVTGGGRRRAAVWALAVLMALRCRRVYFHSVLRMRENGFGRLLYFPWLSRVTDIHGVVPEEFRFHDDPASAALYDREERLAVRRSDLVVVVTEAMHRHLRQKYRRELKADVVVFPMFPRMTTNVAARPYEGGRPKVVYAGGVHKWQQVPKMVAAIGRTRDFCRHEVYCPEPQVFRGMLPEDLRDSLVVESRPHHELMGLYESCHFGFLLREDVVVNHVACPTKAVEYLAKGIVPILDSERIGDFVELGMRFVRLADFVDGRIPGEAERDAMARENLAVFHRLRQSHDAGARAIVERLARLNPRVIARRLRSALARALPPDAPPGRLARRLAARVRPMIRGRGALSVLALPAKARWNAPFPKGRCDVLMQVDNFEAGGLENVVLDLCESLTRAGFGVALLILGSVGAAADRARRAGIFVVASEKSTARYESLLKGLCPSLVLAHYSTFGASSCAARSIPFVQVVHNAYVWLSEEQLRELQDSACHTKLFVAVSQYARRYSVQRLGLPPEKFTVIANGSRVRELLGNEDATRIRRETRDALGIAPWEFVFVSVGAINHQKNHVATVHAFASALDRLPDARLVIVGPVHEQLLFDEIQTLVAERALGSRVICTGGAASAHPYLVMADAFVSAAHFEGGQLSLVEAACANLPVVTTNVGFACHFDGVPGFEVIPPPVDLIRYSGKITEMESPPGFIQRLADAMVRVRDFPRRPDLPREVCEAMDSSRTYARYVQLVGGLLRGELPTAEDPLAGWPSAVERLIVAPVAAEGGDPGGMVVAT